MPYPTDPPVNKHDLKVGWALPSDPATSLLDGAGFTSTAALYQALTSDEAVAPKQHHLLASVYSYHDGPQPPLSRDLMILGVADASLPLVRKFIRDDDDDGDAPESSLGRLHRCTLAVKRSDGEQGRRLPDKDRRNSLAFSQFMRRLQQQDLVAILAADKLGRFGLLQPWSDMSSSSDHHDHNNYDSWEAPDFAAQCFIGKMDQIKSFLSQQSTISSIPNTDNTEEVSVGTSWRPPGSQDNKSNDQNNGDNEEETEEFSWKPPNGAADSSESFDFDMTSSSDPVDRPSLWTSLAGSKRSRDDMAAAVEHAEFHADSGAAAADAFYSRLTRTLETRADSRIYHMRAFNGWVKATQIQELDPKTARIGKKSKPPLRILDLACGKGGDLGKWVLHARGIDDYVGIDVARGSLKDAALRARQMRTKLRRCTFTCADLGSDVPGRFKSPQHQQMQKLLTWSLHQESPRETRDPDFKMMRGGGIALQDKFDVVSIQFAIHYMMSSRQRGRRFFQTVSQLLEVGGNLIATTIDARVVVEHLMNLGLDLHFDDDDENQPRHQQQGATIQVGGGACRIQFEPAIVQRIFRTKTGRNDDENLFGLEYTFTLVEGSDHAAGVGDAVNLPEWLTPIPVLQALAEEAGLELEYAHNFHEFYAIRSDPKAHAASHSSLYNMKVLNRSGSISGEEWEISRLYVALKFRKVRESRMVLDDSDQEDEEDDENDDHVQEVEIDPKVKAKLLPAAMMKAKRAVGDETWKSLSSEEKTRLTDIEVRALALQ